MHAMVFLERSWQKKKRVDRFKLELQKYIQVVGIEGYVDIGKCSQA